MATKVGYRQGTKATYLGLVSRSPNNLYFCTDTKELFKGNDLYSDGLRIVDSYSALPMLALAADGILYYCKDTGCGYVLNESRSDWLPVVHGVDNITIRINDHGLLSVKSVSIESVSGLSDKLKEIESRLVSGVTGSEEVLVAVDGTLTIGAIAQSKIIGLEERLTNIEQTAVGGVHYRGAVDKFEDLPTDAKVGDLYEVYENNTEWCWNGEKWFEYGRVIEMPESIDMDDVKQVAKLVKYEISHKPTGTLVSYRDDEIRVMCPVDTKWTKQNVGSGGNTNMYYMGFKAYAPDGAVGFKEGDRGVIVDQMFTFDSEFAGTDEFGRNYSICWLALASYDETSNIWTYFGAKSTANKYIGWDYVVEWYDKDGIVIATDSIRINLSNESCHDTTTPYYIADIQAALNSLEESYTWADM